MSINLVVAVTDSDWFNLLRQQPPLNEVNFWAPSGRGFAALTPGELFLFKLHAPINKIVGWGVFASATSLPLSTAWEAFGIGNGVSSLQQMRERIRKYRRTGADNHGDFAIGCRVLTQPVFLDEYDWISLPASWANEIVTYKKYGTDSVDGLALWNAVSTRWARNSIDTPAANAPSQPERAAERFGAPQLIRPRLGQGAFRVVVTDHYKRKCAITGEKTLPALDAAHIRPYGDGGEHEPSNGILLRRDIHSLFDAGYVTITPTFHFEVSRRIREEFENGRQYYALHGQQIVVPTALNRRPDAAALKWHNDNRYKGS